MRIGFISLLMLFCMTLQTIVADVINHNRTGRIQCLREKLSTAGVAARQLTPTALSNLLIRVSNMLVGDHASYSFFSYFLCYSPCSPSKETRGDFPGYVNRKFNGRGGRV